MRVNNSSAKYLQSKFSYNGFGKSVAISIVILFFFIAVTPAFALCNESKGGGAAFYDFDRIVVYFSKFPHPDVQKKSNYPSELKFEKFSASLSEAIKKNFAQCLRSKSLWTGNEKDKPVTVTKELTDEVFDPRSLVIIIKLDYRPPSEKTANPELNYGLMQFTFFRNGLSNQDAIRSLIYFNQARAIFPFSANGDLNKRLQSFFEMIAPRDFSTEYLKQHPEYRGRK